jgi:hypothetical protein
MKPLKVRATCSRYQSTSGRNGVSLSLEDDTSRLRVLELDMTLEQFGQLITGLSIPDIEAEVNLMDERLGKKHENLQIVVPNLTKVWEDRDLAVRLFIAADPELAGKGWEPDTLPERPNNHRIAEEGYRVILRRYV